MKMDMPEIVETSIRTTADCSPIPMRKSRLYHDVTKAAPSKDKDPDDISSSSTAKLAFLGGVLLIMLDLLTMKSNQIPQVSVRE